MEMQCTKGPLGRSVHARVVGLSLAIAVGAACPPVGFAQETPSKDLLDCRAIGSDDDRLACYDAALDAQYGVDEELVEKRKEYRRQRFGLPVDSSGARMTELEAIVAAVDSNLRTRQTTVALDNGQEWQVLSTGGLRAQFKPGQSVTISESATGGYRIRIADKKGFKGVSRVR
ncbi:hypothetical protein J7348_02560 [Qipengyuania flava]|uniref:hypothetical protein n=1 Tax=Qipengyuania flava TaxID=192812 RepID=UPI001ADA06BC|nr:hypothetical protein [Qipengyuania flava]MBO9503496.1 hypothetical protein [Qipengyuania flava]